MKRKCIDKLIRSLHYTYDVANQVYASICDSAATKTIPIHLELESYIEQHRGVYDA